MDERVAGGTTGTRDETQNWGCDDVLLFSIGCGSCRLLAQIIIVLVEV